MLNELDIFKGLKQLFICIDCVAIFVDNNVMVYLYFYCVTFVYSTIMIVIMVSITLKFIIYDTIEWIKQNFNDVRINLMEIIQKMMRSINLTNIHCAVMDCILMCMIHCRDHV